MSYRDHRFKSHYWHFGPLYIEIMGSSPTIGILGLCIYRSSCTLSSWNYTFLDKEITLFWIRKYVYPEKSNNKMKIIQNNLISKKKKKFSGETWFLIQKSLKKIIQVHLSKKVIFKLSNNFYPKKWCFLSRKIMVPIRRCYRPRHG